MDSCYLTKKDAFLLSYLSVTGSNLSYSLFFFFFNNYEIYFYFQIICTHTNDALLITLLTANQIGDAGATQLADALHRNSTLTALSLDSKHDIIYVVVCHCNQYL